MRRRAAFLIIGVIALAATACGKESAKPSASDGEALSETTLPACVINQGTIAPAKTTGHWETIKPGVLTVGSDTEFPPFESIEGGKAVGFDIDLINDLAKRLDPPLTVEVQSAVFDTIFTSLAAGKFDVVISAATIKEERKKTIDFTDPYFTADLSISVRESDADSLKGVDDLKGKIIGTQAATTSEDCAKNALKAKGKIKDVRSYDTAPDAFTDLAAGRVDAVLIDLPTAKQIVKQRSGIRVAQVVRTQEQYGIAVAKTNPDLRAAISAALRNAKDDGTFKRLFVKWFKTEPPE